MFGWFPRRLRLFCSKAALPFSTFSASSNPSNPPPQFNRLLFDTLSSTQLGPSLRNPPTPLQDLVDQFRQTQPHLPIWLSDPSNDSGSVEKSGSLAARYQYSSSRKDAEELLLQVFKFGFIEDLFLCNSLINVYARISDMDSARKVFDEMSERNCVTWSCLLSGYTQNGMPNEACDVFRRMISAGFLPNHYAFGSAIRASLESDRYGWKFGIQIHGLMSKTPFSTDVTACNVLISMYGSHLGTVESAQSVFDEIQTKNLITWNAMISVYSRIGDAFSAFALLSSMQKEADEFGCKPNQYAFGSLISAASSLVYSGLNVVEQMLARVEKSGFSCDLYVGSAFVSGFARLGSIGHSKKLFQQMNYRNAVSLNGLIIGLVKQNQPEEAVEFFSEMKDLIRLNVDSYVVLLSAVSEFTVSEEGKRKGQEVHAHAIVSGLIDAKIATGNGLINMYSKCSAIDDALMVFRSMDDKDSVSWNSMITGLDHNKRWEDAVEGFQAMRRTGLKPSNFTIISSLSSCASLGWILLGEQIHCEGLKLGLDLDVSVSNALLALYAEIGDLHKCEKVFFLMPEHDQISWNSMIGALADSEESKFESVKRFIDMMQAGFIPNRVTFINILSAVSSLSLHRLSHQIHALVFKFNASFETTIENAFLACYGKCGNMGDCESIFSRMVERRDGVSWNSMISGYIHNELLSQAMDLVWIMMQRGQRMDDFTFATVLSACATVATLGRGMEVHACSVRACLESDVVVGSTLVDMYGKCGRIDYASRFFDLMPVKNIYSWNSMISGFARHGRGKEALNVFKRLKLHGEIPDHVTFVGVLSACSHVGLIDDGFKHFDSMSQVYGLAPRMEHFSCMVDLLGRVGKLDNVEEFIDKMPMQPNILIWRTVLGACCRSNGRKMELGRKAAKMLFELEPQNGVNYVLLANMYAASGKWEDVAKARMAMKKASVKKEAGCSWVNMNDGVHVFVAGDKSHPENEAIYRKLNELGRKMRDSGYVPETKYALYDLEMENKEEVLSHHSEKIAVAFVLTRKSEMPIRIMKNLRVCGDCHTAFKFISEIVGRQIILRDSNRFHHFDDGQCTCGDFW